MNRPGGDIATRPLHVHWILHCSRYMLISGKIPSLNYPIREALPAMREAARKNPQVEVLLRAVKFSDDAEWHIPQPTLITDFKWYDVQADGVTNLGRALRLVADEMRVPPMPQRAVPPVLVLVSDGQPTDDYKSGIWALLSEEWGRRAVRLAIAIGQDAKHGPLQEFIGHEEIRPLQANNPGALVSFMKWVSSTGLFTASRPRQADENPVDPRLSESPKPKVDSIVW